MISTAAGSSAAAGSGAAAAGSAAAERDNWLSSAFGGFGSDPLFGSFGTRYEKDKKLSSLERVGI